MGRSIGLEKLRRVNVAGYAIVFRLGIVQQGISGG